MHPIHQAPSNPDRFEKLLKVLRSIYDEREAVNISVNLKEFLTELSDEGFMLVLQRLLNKEPWQYVAGKSWFYGLELFVNQNVLIPRQETEELVYLLLNNHPDYPPLNVLDIGTGSGCIPLAIHFNRPHWQLKAIDISGKALEVADKNARSCGLHIEWECCDFLNNIPAGGPWDILVSNPPYISETEIDLMPEHVLQYEPHVALFAPKEEPMLFYRVIAEKGTSLLSSGGYIYLEINEFRAEATKDIFVKTGYRDVNIHMDLAGRPRFITARKEG